MLPTLLIAALALAGGLAGGYFFYRLRFRRKLGLLEARETALGNRESEMEALRHALSARTEAENIELEKLTATVQMLKEDIAGRDLDISILKEELSLESRALRDQLESRRSGSAPQPADGSRIEDAVYAEATAPADTMQTRADETDRPGSTAGASVENRPPSTDAEEASSSTRSPGPNLTDSVLQAGEWAAGVFGKVYSELRTSLTSPSDTHGSETSTSGDEAVPTEEDSPPTGDEAVPSEEGNANVEDGSPPTAGETTPSKSAPPEKSRAVPERSYSDDIQSRFPAFRSLSDLFETSVPGTSLGLNNPDETGSNMSSAGDGEAFRNAASPGSTADPEELQALLGLSNNEFARLREMGFRSFEDIALLSSPEIRTISERLDIPEDRIEKVWISGAQLHLYEGP